MKRCMLCLVALTLWISVAMDLNDRDLASGPLIEPNGSTLTVLA